MLHNTSVNSANGTLSLPTACWSVSLLHLACLITTVINPTQPRELPAVAAFYVFSSSGYHVEAASPIGQERKAGESSTLPTSLRTIWYRILVAQLVQTIPHYRNAVLSCSIDRGFFLLTLLSASAIVWCYYGVVTTLVYIFACGNWVDVGVSYWRTVPLAAVSTLFRDPTLPCSSSYPAEQ